MRNKFVVSALVVFGLLAAIVTPVSGLWNAFGDSSVRLSTPIIDGVRTSCTDGFDYRVAYKPNGSETAMAGDPTGLPAGGGFPTSFRTYRFDDVRNPDGSLQTGLVADFSVTPSRWIDDATGTPVPDLGVFSADIDYVDTYFDSDPGDPDNLVIAALTSGSFSYTTAQPVGTRIEINGATMDFPRFIEVVEDCEPEPPVVGPEINVFPFKNDYGIVSFRFSKVVAAVVNDGSFDPYAVDDLQFGPAGASPRWTVVFDIDGDGDKDVVGVFRRSKTGIECGDTSVTMSGTVDGAVFSADSPIKTFGCKK